MGATSDQVKKAFTAMIVQVIRNSKTMDNMNLFRNRFDAARVDEICAALTANSLPTLKTIRLNRNPSWFDSDEKCTAWAAAFKNQPNLEILEL